MDLHNLLPLILSILENVLIISCLLYSSWLLRLPTTSPTAFATATGSLLLCIVMYLTILRLPRDSALAVTIGIMAAVVGILMLLLDFLVTAIPLPPPPPPPPAAPANAAP